ncbi:Detected protein of unknown function [Hibiscus syriacus]|uniref:NB-ARC domain-containing protein n=1 Tax=Hibiscus syriacus TaxID=106335 RepID=A0A6A3CE00_HIBSY|nr:Detected protein of unknown function [Hibiscus syriacus]
MRAGKETMLTSVKAKKEVVDVILNQLHRDIVLTGSPGTGKTWLAKEVTRRADDEKCPFQMSLWLSLSLRDKQDEGMSLLQSIARQLSVPNIGSTWEDADYNNTDEKKKEEKKKEELVDNLKKLMGKVAEKLWKDIYLGSKSKDETKHINLLLVLDSEGDVKIDELPHLKDHIFHLLSLDSDEPNMQTIAKELKVHESESKIRFLITSTGGKLNESVHEIKVEPFSEKEETVTFLKERVGDGILEPSKSKFEKLYEEIKEHFPDKTKVLPAQLIMLAGALKRIAVAEQDHIPSAPALDAALQLFKAAKPNDEIPVLRFVYETLIEKNDGLFDFFWHSWNLLGNHGGVQYNALIAHWILEGHLDLADGVKKAYEKGYGIMMELVDLGILKMQEDNLIVLERATRTLEDHECREHFEKSKLGLAGMLKGQDSKVFERMAPTEGMMRTVSVDKEGKSISSMLIDGSSLCREDNDTYFKEKDLKVLALFNPRMQSLPPICQIKDLLLLVLRGCYLLNSVDQIKDLEKLVVLEVSGSPNLTEMEEGLFDKMTKLQSLNLSALGIKSLPQVSSLKELRRLILKDCHFLEALPKLANLKHMEVIDLSGSCSLNRLREKSFKSFKELRFADFSGTKIEKLPIVQTLPKLTILLAKGCDRLAGLRFMKRLEKLKVLDISGATRIKEIFFDCFDGTDNLRFLDLSETNIRFLPESLGKHLCRLTLKSCSKLEKLLNSQGLTDLQALDLSNSSGLQKFPDDFFVNLTSLQSLDLSNSQVKCFPSLSKLGNLRKLLLKGCSFERLPESKTFGSFEGLTNLEELDLSDCKSQAEQFPRLEDLNKLKIIKLSGYKALSEIDSLKHTPELEDLDLSETQISTLPNISSKKLRSIILNKCTQLKEAPDFQSLPNLFELDLRGYPKNACDRIKSLENLSGEAVEYLPKKLEVLDLSGEAVESLPSSLVKLTDLKQLLLKGCSSLKELPSLNTLSQLEVLDLSGIQVENLGDKISDLRNMKSLHLPGMVADEFKGGKNVDALPMELKLDHCCISESSEIPQGDSKPRIVVQGTELLKSLKENSALLESIRNSISSVRAKSKDEDNYCDSRKHIFGDIYTKVRKFPSEDAVRESLEIHGFDGFPTGIEVLLEHARYVVLLENGFMNNLSDLKPDSLKNISGCWLERCNKMVTIFVEADQGKWGTLEILWISNLPELKSLYDEKVQSLSFGSIKSFLKTFVGDKGPDDKEIQTPDSTNQKMQTMNPKDKEGQNTASSVGKKVPDMTSSAPKQMQVMSTEDKVKEREATASRPDDEGKGPEDASPIDKGKKDEEVKMQAASLEDNRDEEPEGATSVDKGKEEEEAETQDPSSVDKGKKDEEAGTDATGLANKELQATQSTSGIKLKHLHISYCPMLETVFSSQQVPEKLEILRIKHCVKMNSVFPESMIDRELPKLKTLQLSDLPSWTRSEAGFKVNKSVTKIIESPPPKEATPAAEN